MKHTIDYAPYYLDTKLKLKEAHELLLKSKFEEAATKVDEMIVELRMMRAAIKTHLER